MEKSKKEDQKQNLEIKYYIQPDVPLAFNFNYDVTLLEHLLTKEQTSGNKRVKKDDKESIKKLEDEKEHTNNNINNEEEEKGKAKPEIYMQYEGSIRADQGPKKMAETKQKRETKHNEIKKEEKKKMVIRYLKYTNSINLSNNKLKNIIGLRSFLEEVLPDLSFKSKVPKVDLLQWIDISRNKLTEISSDIAELKFLKILYAHGNNIQQIEKVLPLKDCQSLSSLTLYGNPIDHIKGYRHFIIEMCPILEKFDSAVISEKELDIIKFRGCRYGEVRRKDGSVKTYPKLPDEIIKTIQQLQEESNRDKKDE